MLSKQTSGGERIDAAKPVKWLCPLRESRLGLSPHAGSVDIFVVSPGVCLETTSDRATKAHTYAAHTTTRGRP